MIVLRPVTPENWRLRLKVSPEQERFVAASAVLLARAYAYREQNSRAFVICDDELPVGMALFYDWFDEDGRGAYDFSQLFIDERYQHRGLGLEAARKILDLMREDGRFDRVVLCYIEGNDEARRLYEKLGFTHTGEADGDEIIMEKML
ncbi:MAG: GNAT family N-acetyltransferase [Clostridia bacterium]|nr:GNAT family N-acetyltransferase [Clostridia bacterium]